MSGGAGKFARREATERTVLLLGDVMLVEFREKVKCTHIQRCEHIDNKFMTFGSVRLIPYCRSVSESDVP